MFLWKNLYVSTRLYGLKFAVDSYLPLVRHISQFSFQFISFIATRYCLDGTGIKSRLGRNFPHPSRSALEPTQSPRAVVPPVTALVTGGKSAGAWR